MTSLTEESGASTSITFEQEDNAVAHPHANILGVRISAIDMATALAIADHRIRSGNRGYICLTGVHGVMEAFADPELRGILNRSLVNAPDGMPMSWVGWLQGYSRMDRVFGPDFMLELCRVSVARGYRHYFYGGKPGVTQSLRASLTQKCRGLQVVGVYTPPFRELSQHEEQDVLRDIERTRPDIVWVGLSTPQQERFMAHWSQRLDVRLMVGVGAAFDYHTGRIRDCAPWIKRAGLQWLHRVLQDPQRLTRRYLRTHPAFVWHMTLQMIKMHSYRGDTS